jgi:hypothetical protein
MVQQRTSAKTLVILEQVVPETAPESQEANQERNERDKTAAINDWLSSKICAKAC